MSLLDLQLILPGLPHGHSLIVSQAAQMALCMMHAPGDTVSRVLWLLRGGTHPEPVVHLCPGDGLAGGLDAHSRHTLPDSSCPSPTPGGQPWPARGLMGS